MSNKAIEQDRPMRGGRYIRQPNGQLVEDLETPEMPPEPNAAEAAVPAVEPVEKIRKGK